MPTTLRHLPTLLLSASLLAGPADLARAAEPEVGAVLATYADIAAAAYGDSLATAKTLQAAVDRLIAEPSETNLAAAREAWKAARVPYMQTEAFRFGNRVVDDWEGRVNSWPLDEGLIDYVAGEYGSESAENPLYVANVVANRSIRIGAETIDASTITRELLADKLQEGGGIEANVATGYHAVEFLLWGQDLNGTGPGAGARPATDFDTANCTNGHCDRRAAYLKVATDLLVEDLGTMAADWADGGAARRAVGEGNAGLATIFTGLGSLSYGELAGERMKLGLLVHDPEEEHDCFSDNTHNSHYYDALGILNIYRGSYTRIDGSVVKGPSPSDIVKAKAPEIDGRVNAALDATMERMTALVDRAKSLEAYDQMIGEGNAEGNAAVDQAVTALLRQTKEIERAVTALELSSIDFEGSDSLDNPAAVLQ
ncbi:MAG: imelysin family protein [Hyphomicrobiaceae bacterium]